MRTRHSRALASVATSILIIAWAVAATAAQTRGARPKQHTSNRKVRPAAVVLPLAPVITETGKLSVSVDGTGTTSEVGIVQVEKPAGASVRVALFLAATDGFTNHRISSGDVTLDGVGITWDMELFTSIESYSYLADVTALVKPKLDSAPAGRVDFAVTEVETDKVSGEILAVIFDDPSQNRDVSAVLYFGTHDIDGDSVSIGLVEPIDRSSEDLRIDLGLGINFGFQSPVDQDQVTIIDVNGSRMTSSAGGQDDGETEPASGAFITVGGLDDDRANPDPFAPPADFDTDDELYDLIPFVSDGDIRIHIETRNPSRDDNLFFAALVTSERVVEDQALILTPKMATAKVGDDHTVTATLHDSEGVRIPGAEVTFEITSGPHAGTTSVGTTDGDGQATFTYTGTSAGIDSIAARVVGGPSDIRSNVVAMVWEAPVYSLMLAPVEATAPVFTEHEITATLLLEGVPVAGHPVLFDVFQGPHEGVGGEALTNEMGDARFSYFGGAAGIDSIGASVLVDGGPAVHADPVSATWVVDHADYALDLSPVSAANPVNSTHTLVASFAVLGSPLGGVPVTFDVYDGPNAGAGETVATDDGGVAQWAYQGAVAGTDSIRASVRVEGAEPIRSNAASKEWLDVYALELVPDFDSNPMLTRHTVTSLLLRNDVPVEGQSVRFEVIAGPNRGTSGLEQTNFAGEASFEYLSLAVGTDSIVASVQVYGTTITSNAVVKDWFFNEDDYSLQLSPASASNEVGTDHTLTAVLLVMGNAAPEIPVKFDVFAGPHAGTADSAVTDAQGQASFTYTGTTEGTDSIAATVTIFQRDKDDGATSAFPPVISSNVAVKTWTDIAAYLLVLNPSVAVNPVGSDHTLTASLTHSGEPVPGHEVTFTVFAGPHAGEEGAAVTDAAGDATFAYTGTAVGTDSIRAAAVIDLRKKSVADRHIRSETIRSNVAVKTWTREVEYVLGLEPESAANPVGTEHGLVATLLADGVPAPDVAVEFSIISGPHAGVTAVDSTDTKGQAVFAYMGTAVGIDTIVAEARVDDDRRIPSNPAVKVWLAEAVAIGLDIKPGSCPNPVNTKSKGVTTAALLGSEEIDVRDVDVATLELEGVAPVRYAFEDVSRAGEPGDCPCSTKGADGYRDLTLKFDTEELVAALGPVENGETRVVTVTGRFKDGRAFSASDCVRIIDNGTGPPGDAPVPRGLTLKPAFPNPFNPTTRIAFYLPDDGHVRLSVYDVAGRRVAVLVDEARPAGEHIVRWDARGLPSGIYYYKLDAGGRVLTEKVTLLR